MQYAPTRIHEKTGGFHIFPSGYAKNAPGFTIPNKDAPKNAPDFTLPDKDTPKTHPVLDPNLWCKTFRGVCNMPLHGYMKNPAGFIPKSSAQDISGRMLLRPTRVHEKFGGFHISTPGCTQNPPSFPLPNKDTTKTRPVLDPNLRRGTFWGVCFCALHGYTQNLAGFIPPYTDKPKTHPVLDPNLWRGTFWGVYNTPLHGYMQNLASFRPKPLARNIWGAYAFAPLHGYVQNLTGFIFPHTI